MDIAISFVRRKKHNFLTTRILFALTVLLCTLFLSSCIGPADPRLPAEYFGTSWECTDPYAVFEVTDEGFCDGTISFEGTSFPARFSFFPGQHFDIYILLENVWPGVFVGEYTITGDSIIAKGAWSSSLMEEYCNITPEEGKCTLIFERKN